MQLINISPDNKNSIWLFRFLLFKGQPKAAISRNDTAKFIYIVVPYWDINDNMEVVIRSIYGSQVDTVPLNSIFTFIGRKMGAIEFNR